MQEKLKREQLLELLDKIMRPGEYNLTEEEDDKILLQFCAGCPDPVGARTLIVDCLDPMTDEQLVDRALSMPLRRMIDVPTSVIPAGHPLRTMAQ